MLNYRVLLTMGLCFFLGTLLGMMIHLPGVSFHLNQMDSSTNPKFGELYRSQRAVLEDSSNTEAPAELDTEQEGPSIQSTVFVGKKMIHKKDLFGLNGAPQHRMKDIQGSLVQGCFWSDELEKFVPRGFTKNHQISWNNHLQSTRVVELSEGCGRMQNRRLVFEDASKACARYRINIDQIQGEIFSYYLARLLNLENVPASTTHKINVRNKLWKSVSTEIASSQWSDEKPLVLTQWINDLVPAYIPVYFRDNQNQLNPNEISIYNKTLSDLTELVQWSDLIIFDYLTANIDRVINNVFNKQWNSNIMEKPVHNLEKTRDSGLLVFIDNESGLFHSYRLLEKYSPYHEQLLKSLCIFRKRTSKRIKEFAENGRISEAVWQLFKRTEPEISANLVPQIPSKNGKILRERLRNVWRHIQKCQQMYGGSL
ncbi:extracellular serine/threonine protein kinase four-jointed-like [Tubulanus polymorphus]|uniref:extracellular serine/threonine protein kinase four-jointed-like n=1 Tax=Tubulanus polymorphus TaxID=672921 RepID=UPI003DA5B2A7